MFFSFVGRCNLNDCRVFTFRSFWIHVSVFCCRVLCLCRICVWGFGPLFSYACIVYSVLDMCFFLLVAFACVAHLVTVTFMVCPCFTRLTYCFNEGKIKPGFMLTNALLLLEFPEPF